MKIKAILVDDEENARKALSNMLEYYCKEVEVIGQAANISAAHALIIDLEPDVVFLDIQMPGGSGFELLKKFRTIPFKVIFVTAFDQFALKAIKLSAIDYLLKPVSPRDLIKAVEKLGQRMEVEEHFDQQLETLEANMQPDKQHKKIILNTSNNMYVLRIEDVIRCEADENYTRVINLDGKSIMVAKTLKDFDELLSAFGFCRIHQSHLINLNHVLTYEKGSGGMVLLSNKERIPVSSRRKEFFLSALQNHL
ncbi:MAG: LytTR family DNA-binding domain-containing protein [Bacteroidetes bacterium]|jgi:two-component system LytT family response regulator|nr:LytTR family DNA-binding domain-containing protein [Bacteroidota bacterium]